MNKDQLERMAQASAKNLETLIVSMSDDIQASAIAAAEQAQEDGKETLKLKLTHMIEIDLGTLKQKNRLSVSTRRSSQLETDLPEPEE